MTWIIQLGEQLIPIEADSRIDALEKFCDDYPKQSANIKRLDPAEAWHLKVWERPEQAS